MYLIYDHGHHIDSVGIALTLEQAWEMADQAFKETHHYLTTTEFIKLKKKCRLSRGYFDYCDDAKITINKINPGEWKNEP